MGGRILPLTKCEQCGKLKEVSKSRLARNKHNFCSTTCRNKWMSLNLVGENHLHFGKKRSQSTKDNISKANKGRTFTPEWKDKIAKTLTGRKASAETKAKMSEQRKGEKHPLYGKSRSEETRIAISKSLQGNTPSEESNKKRSISLTGSKNHQWREGTSFGKYCPKFNDEFKERVRKFFHYTCQMCGHVWRPGERRLCVHHINYEKQSCCDKSIKPLFVVVCHGNCHNQTNNNREYWYQHFQELIAIQHGGRCYLPK